MRGIPQGPPPAVSALSYVPHSLNDTHRLPSHHAPLTPTPTRPTWCNPQERFRKLAAAGLPPLEVGVVDVGRPIVRGSAMPPAQHEPITSMAVAQGGAACVGYMPVHTGSASIGVDVA